MQINKIFSSLLLIGSFGCHATSLYRVHSLDMSFVMDGFYTASSTVSLKGTSSDFLNLGIIETKPTSGNSFTMSIGDDTPCVTTGGVSDGYYSARVRIPNVGQLRLDAVPHLTRGFTSVISEDRINLKFVDVGANLGSLAYVIAADGLDRFTTTCTGWLKHHRESSDARTNITVTAIWHLAPKNSLEVVPERRVYDVNCQVGSECRIETGVAVNGTVPYVRLIWGEVPGVEYIVEGRRYNIYSTKLTFYSEESQIHRVDVAVTEKSPHYKTYSIPVTATII